MSPEILRICDQEEFEPLWSYLHDKLGLCSHCGRKNCPHPSGTDLPDFIPFNVLQAAIAHYVQARATRGER